MRERRGRKDGQSRRRKSARWPPLNLSFLFLGSGVVSCPCAVVPGHFSPLCPFISLLGQIVQLLTGSLSFPCFFLQIFNSLSAPRLVFPSFTPSLFSHPPTRHRFGTVPLLSSSLPPHLAVTLASPQLSRCSPNADHGSGFNARDSLSGDFGRNVPTGSSAVLLLDLAREMLSVAP